MGKVLLIEPQRILGQAISLSLFPEHEVQVAEEWSGGAAASLKEYDLLIVDGVALRESNQLTPEVTRAIQSCKTPTVWLEEDESQRQPKRDNLVVVKKPVEREAFQAALTALLSPDKGRKERIPVAPGRTRVDAGKTAVRKKSAEAPRQAAFQFIDLVDVVEEQPAPRAGKKPARKPK